MVRRVWFYLLISSDTSRLRSTQKHLELLQQNVFKKLHLFSLIHV